MQTMSRPSKKPSLLSSYIAPKPSRRTQRILKLAGVVSLALWMGGIALSFQYDGTRPTMPQPDKGRTYALNSHGHVVYLTRSEWVQLNGLLGLGWVGLATGIGVGLRLTGKI